MEQIEQEKEAKIKEKINRLTHSKSSQILFRKLNDEEKEEYTRNEIEKIMKNQLTLSNASVSRQVISKATSEKIGVDLWKNFDHQLSSLNQMIRVNKQGIMDLFEDSEHGINANSGF